jgi:hypothetical protein
MRRRLALRPWLIRRKQDTGVAATSKHYIGYEQETFRNVYGTSTPYSGFGRNEQLPIDSIIDDTTNHELYLWPFAEAVRAGTSCKEGIRLQSVRADLCCSHHERLSAAERHPRVSQQ